MANNPWNVRAPASVTQRVKEALTDQVINNAINNGANTTGSGDKYKILETEFQRYTPEEAESTFAALRNTPEFKEQQAGIDELSLALGDLKKQPRVSENSWLKPLLALADSEYGTNLMKGYTESETNKNRNETILRYQNEIARRKENATNQMLSSLGKFRAGDKVSGGEMTSSVKNVQDPAQILKSIIAAESAGNKKAGAGKETSYEREIGKGIAKHQLEGGSASMRGDVDTLNEAVTEMDKKGDMSDWFSKFGTGVVEFFGGRTDLSNLANRVSGVNIKNMKATFPGAISNYESQKWESLNFDRGAGDKENMYRTKKKAEILQAIQKKIQIMEDYYFDNNQSMRGFNPEVLRKYDYTDSGDTKTGSGGGGKTTGGFKPKTPSQLANMTQAQLDAYEKELQGGN